MIFLLNLFLTFSFGQSYFQNNAEVVDQNSIIYKAAQAQSKFYTSQEYSQNIINSVNNAYDLAYDSRVTNTIDLKNPNLFLQKSIDEWQSHFDLFLIIKNLDNNKIVSVRIYNNNIGLDETYLNLNNNKIKLPFLNCFELENLYPLNIHLTYENEKVAKYIIEDGYYCSEGLVEIISSNE